MSPEQAAEWSPQEAKAVLIAWATIQREQKKAGLPAPDIMKFRVYSSLVGWEVYVHHVGAYDDGEPVARPSSFTVVKIDTEWRIISIVGGA